MTREELLARGRKRDAPRGIETVTVPGALAGWDALLRKYGTMTLAQAIAPAIRYAEQGYPVTPIIARDWKDAEEVLGARLRGEGDVHAERACARAAGEWFRNPDYARTLREIAPDGPSVFYGGALGQRIVEARAGARRLSHAR